MDTIKTQTLIFAQSVGRCWTMSKPECNSLVGKRVRVFDDCMVRYGTITQCLSKQETKECMMFGRIIKAKMEDTGKEEEFLYGWEIEQ